jgi:hypothetical protein
MIHGTGEDAAKITFSDLPLEKGIELAKEMPWHSTISFANELTYPGYKYVPSSWVFCEEDLVLPPIFQQQCIDLIEKESGKRIHVERLNAAHCPEHSKPTEEAEAIHRAIIAT